MPWIDVHAGWWKDIMSLQDPYKHIRECVVGEGAAAETPFGMRRLTYCDHAASGRAYGPIEDFIRTNVLPFYGNTHTETSATGAQTTAFREGARALLKAACGCSDEDVLIFTGNGVTGAVHTLIGCLGLAVPCCMKDRYGIEIPQEHRPVVLIGEYEHHSNELPWRECEVDVFAVKACDDGGVDLDDLERLLVAAGDRVKIGSFSAASNVTGRITNVNAVAERLHDHGAIAFFDYAAAGPYMRVDMNPAQHPLAYKDAVFLSMHKFLGGPGSPGILLAKKRLFDNRTPHVVGGGTVNFVTPERHTFLSDIEHREEGGTPNIVGSIRAGLAMQLRESASAEGILAHEQRFAKEFIQRVSGWHSQNDVTVLGNLEEARLGIVSFVIEHTQPGKVTLHEKKALHHNFVVALLNDLFGIQARGGNSCAAPFAHRLLGVSEVEEEALEAVVEEGWHGAKPGWARVSFGWYDSEDTLNFVIEAVKFIAMSGWAFLNRYSFNPRTGTWRQGNDHAPFEVGRLHLRSPASGNGSVVPESARWEYLELAKRYAKQWVDRPFEPTPFEHLRWFWLPGEVP